MKQLRRCWPLLSLVAVGCASMGGLTVTERGLVGTWRDEGDAVTTIEARGGEVVVASIVDYDGEVFEVREYGWEGDVYYWVYHVPSTGYTVTTRVHEIGENELQTTWSNDQGGSSEEVHVRVGG